MYSYIYMGEFFKTIIILYSLYFNHNSCNEIHIFPLIKVPLGLSCTCWIFLIYLWIIKQRSVLDADSLNLFFMQELEEESIRDNFVIVYELLDELLDFGYPQTTDSKILQEWVPLLYAVFFSLCFHDIWKSLISMYFFYLECGLHVNFTPCSISNVIFKSLLSSPSVHWIFKFIDQFKGNESKFNFLKKYIFNFYSKT